MEGKNVRDYVFRKQDQVVPIDKALEVKVGKNSVEIDPQLLFQRLVTASTNCGELNEVFAYELCSYPPALFHTTDVLLEADKPPLANAMWKIVSNIEITVPQEHTFVLDGGALLHRISWVTGKTWQDMANSFCTYVVNKYDKSCVVFDGYESGLSTKQGTQSRRARGVVGPTVHFTPDMICTVTKEKFLANPSNKQRFINLLASVLDKEGCQVLNARADADVLIVQTAIKTAESQTTIVVGDDTDLLVLLCKHVPAAGYQIYFRPEPKVNSKTQPRCWDIRTLQQSLGQHVCDIILFVHALLGCDTTSRIYGIGKPMALKMAATNIYFQQQPTVFNCNTATKTDIITAGENALVALYHGNPGESLDHLRLQVFYKKVSRSTTCVHPRGLPPTSAAAKYHLLRVYHQVQQWSGLELPPADWGWSVRGNQIVPISMDLPPAPVYLLEAIHCSCKSGCQTMRCSCKKYGPECSLACENCTM